MTYLCTGLFLAGLGFAVGGYVVGESWKQAMRSMSEQEMMEKIEARTQEILAKELMTEEKEMGDGGCREAKDGTRGNGAREKNDGGGRDCTIH